MENHRTECAACGGTGFRHKVDGNGNLWAEPGRDCEACGGTGKAPEGEAEEECITAGNGTVSASAFVRFDEEKAGGQAAEALAVQVGGNHYKDMVIQPIEFIQRNGIGFAEGNVIKYVCRYAKKGGLEDLKKARHYIDLLLELRQ